MTSSSKWKTFTGLSCTRIRERRQREKYPVSAFLTPSVTHFSCTRKQKCREEGTSPVAQWLKLGLSMQGLQVQSLVKELRSYMPHGLKTQNIKQKQYCNKFSKDFNKWSTFLKFIYIYIYIYMEKRNLERVSVYLPGSHGSSQVVLVVKNLSANSGVARDSGSVPRLGRSPEERNGNPLQYSCLMNPMDIGAWWVISSMWLQRVEND